MFSMYLSRNVGDQYFVSRYAARASTVRPAALTRRCDSALRSLVVGRAFGPYGQDSMLKVQSPNDFYKVCAKDWRPPVRRRR